MHVPQGSNSKGFRSEWIKQSNNIQECGQLNLCSSEQVWTMSGSWIFCQTSLCCQFGNSCLVWQHIQELLTQGLAAKAWFDIRFKNHSLGVNSFKTEGVKLFPGRTCPFFIPPQPILPYLGAQGSKLQQTLLAQILFSVCNCLHCLPGRIWSKGWGGGDKERTVRPR